MFDSTLVIGEIKSNLSNPRNLPHVFINGEKDKRPSVQSTVQSVLQK